jgi:hypothetical protein
MIMALMKSTVFFVLLVVATTSLLFAGASGIPPPL